jgi:uncharacterized protein YjbI with pentapeptide repeats/tetratricopeptide (TPR) repeat protein
VSSVPDEADLQLASYSDLMPPLPEDVESALEAGDLRGMDLSRLSFRGRDLSGMHLEGCKLERSDLRDVSLDNSNLSGASMIGVRLQGAHLTATDFSEADLSGAVLDGATLERTVLRRTKLVKAHVRDSSWTEVEAEGGDWTGIDLHGARFERVNFQDLDARGAGLDGGHFKDSDLARLHLQDCRAPGLEILDSTIEDTEFDGGDLTGLQVRFANCDRVSLAGANLSASRWESVAFRASNMDGVQAKGAWFARCAGLPGPTLDHLRDVGAVVVLPLHRRFWRGLSRIRFGRAGFALGLLAGAIAIVAFIAQPEPMRPEEPTPEVNDADLAVLPGVDAATAEAWERLQDAYGGDVAGRADTLIAMSAILEQTGRHDDAEEHLREAIGLLQLNPEQRKTSPEIALGRFMLRRERHDEAFDIAREVISLTASQADRVAAYLLITSLRIAQDDPAGALAELSTVTSFFGADGTLPASLRIEAARRLEDVGQTSAALSLLDGAPAELPSIDRAELALARGDLMSRAGNSTEAVSTYDRVVRDFPELPLAVERARRGRADAMVGADPETERLQLEALAAAEDTQLAAEGELGLARLAVRTEDRDAAVRRFARVLERFPDQPDARMTASRELSKLHQALGETDAAVEVLEAAVKEADSDERTVILREDLAKLLQGAGRYDAARSVLRRTLKEFAADLEFSARANLHLAGIADQSGSVEEALELYRAVAGADVELDLRAAARFGEATLQRRIGKVDDALPLMDQVLEMLPASHRLRGSVAVERAELLVDLGRASSSDLESMLETARDSGVDGDQPVAYAGLMLLLAETLEDEDDAAAALGVFQRVAKSPAMDEDPALRQNAHEGQVRSLMMLGRKDEADALLSSSDAQTLSGGGAEEACRGRLAMARGRAETGDGAGAATEFEALLEACRAPRFLVGELPVIADLLAAAGLTERAQAMLVALRDGDLDGVGRQAAQLELGRMGSVEDVEAAMDGPDRALAALARIARGDQLVEDGRLAEAEPLWRHVAEDPAAEPVPRALALIGLGKLEKVRGNVPGARGHFEEARLVTTEGWLIEMASGELAELQGGP